MYEKLTARSEAHEDLLVPSCGAPTARCPRSTCCELGAHRSFDLKFEKVDGAWCKYSGVANDVSALDGNGEWLLQSFYRVSGSLNKSSFFSEN